MYTNLKNKKEKGGTRPQSLFESLHLLLLPVGQIVRFEDLPRHNDLE